MQPGWGYFHTPTLPLRTGRSPPKIHEHLMKTKNIQRTSIDHPTQIYRTSNTHRPSIQQPSIDLQTNIYRTSSKHLSDIQQTSIEPRTNIYRTSTEHPSNRYRMSIERISIIHRTSTEDTSIHRTGSPPRELRYLHLRRTYFHNDNWGGAGKKEKERITER